MSEIRIPKGQYRELEIDKISMPAGNNPREPEPREHLFNLQNSIETLGQLEAVIVTYKMGDKTTDGMYEIIAGRRRIEAAQEAGLKTIEAKVYDNIDRRTLLLMVAAENIHRKAFTAIEEARLIRMLEEEKFHLKVIAAKLGQSIDTVRRKRNLLDLPDDIQKMIAREKDPLPVHQAQMLHGLSKSQQLEAAREIAPVTGPVANEKEAKEIIDKLLGAKLDLETADMDKKPSMPIPKGQKPPKLKTGKRPPKEKEKLTRDQKKNVPKISRQGKTDKTAGPEIEINIGGKVSLEHNNILRFEDPVIWLKIGKVEKTFEEPVSVCCINEKSKIIAAFVNIMKECLAKKTGNKKQKADVEGCMECPKCKSTGGFSCEDSSDKDTDKAKWKCLKCGKIFLR